MTALEILAVTGLPEVVPGSDLAALISGATVLRDGDILVVTSKVVSKAEGRVVRASREEVLADETDRVVARRGPTTIVRTHHGLVMAAAGIDASNTAPGTVVLLPRDPDASARALRARLTDRTRVNVAVVVSDTSGRAWRQGQTDIAVGAAGLLVLDDHAGRVDAHGNLLAVTAPAIADEVAGASDLVKGKTSGTPVAVVRGLAHLLLPPGEHGPGAAALVRPEAEDLFGLGAREAVLRALQGDDLRGFGDPADVGDLEAALRSVVPYQFSVSASGSRLELTVAAESAGADPRAAGRLEARVAAVAAAHGWRCDATVSADHVTLLLTLP